MESVPDPKFSGVNRKRWINARPYAIWHAASSSRSSVCPSVRPSVCHTRGLCLHGSTYAMIMISSPCGSPMILVLGNINVHPKIRRGSPRAKALNEGGGG